MPRNHAAPSALQTIAAQAIQLSRVDRLELIAILQAGNEAGDAAAEKMEREDQKQAALDRRGIRGGRGSFEDKFINGYGPYRYLRYWYGKTHKSLYLGKVPCEDHMLGQPGKSSPSSNRARLGKASP